MKLAAVALVAATAAVAQNIPSIAWGFASSAYQVEGAWNVDGKGPSVWDHWFLNNHSLVASKGAGNPIAAGDVFKTAGHYDRMKEDVALMASFKSSMYRFSVAWSRIFPQCNGQVNQKGIDFYSRLIDELLNAGIQPVLTMYHWDTPQACEDQYGSLLNRDMFIRDFTSYADVLYANFGSRVKYWLTFNEPAAYCGRGFGPVNDAYIWPPGKNGRESDKYNCIATTSIAHGVVVQLARSKYPQYEMKFSMPLIIAYYIPVAPADVEQANINTLSQGDWLWGSLASADGDYPAYLKTVKTGDMDGSLLPSFTAAEKATMKGTLDYIALNYYSAQYFNGVSGQSAPTLTIKADQVPWQSAYPGGIRGITQLMARSYGPLLASSVGGLAPIMISECGYGSISEAFGPISQSVNDVDRQAFFEGITAGLQLAVVEDKTPVFGFLAWSLLDNLEWLTFDQTWGLVHVDQQGGTLERTVKQSANKLAAFFAGSKSPIALALPGSKPANSTVSSAPAATASGAAVTTANPTATGSPSKSSNSIAPGYSVAIALFSAFALMLV
ncbi:hypothetical protein CcCBS67573_g10199 [Chytriomyces confervae]|uniref:Beta-glucosidase n=1 Tax=Chytriomyces confervae TaxID=246404 RepID=A0A507DA24_9FUNG|nr:hypothetical protein CcCBS67573_g10199 [Chytriomyces confervae]